ncbi:MAG: CRISPR system precrRNA processing endoribonuclease RAMP protein Cas6 [Nitrospirota bacterium]
MLSPGEWRKPLRKNDRGGIATSPAGIADPRNLMLQAFSLSWFRFVLEPENRVALHPRNPGNTLRGAFGSTFKRLVCPTPADCRETCRLKATCPHGQIFEPSPPPGADRLSLNQDIPRPFVFRPPNGIETTARPGEVIQFDLILIGKALDYFPYFLVTFRELGDQGIGLGRGRYEISRVMQLDPLPAFRVPQPASGNQIGESGQRITDSGAIEIYSAKDQLVRPSQSRLTFQDCHLAAEQLTISGLQTAGSVERSADCGWRIAGCGARLAEGGSRSADSGMRIMIRFLTPTLLKADGRIVERPEFHHLIKRLRDRINALAHFYCDDALDIDFKAFGERAEAVRTASCRIRWEDRDRRSWKTGLTHDMGGFVGDVTYEGDLEEFLPLLILGQYTHVGKYAVWGHGQYEILQKD